jgi:hypothetical protein
VGGAGDIMKEGYGRLGLISDLTPTSRVKSASNHDIWMRPDELTDNARFNDWLF